MPEKIKVRCTGTVKTKKNEIIPCNTIIAEIVYASDCRIEIQCRKCGLMNVIEAKPSKKESSQNMDLGTFPIVRTSESN